MKVCVIGAGAAGLCAIKQGISFGCEVIAFEQTDKIGGTWVYTDEVGIDSHGLAVHSSMYQGLHTNLPKEMMGFPDFPFRGQEKSYVEALDVLRYLQSYAHEFNIQANIKFSCHVLRVRPMLDDTWEVIVNNLISDKYETYMFDVVLVCNGHYSTPNMPKFNGQNFFKGRQMHSHDYRRPEPFKNETVLVIGAGPSGTDISQEISKYALRILWSNHSKRHKIASKWNVIQKPDVASFSESGVTFVDGTSEEIQTVVYCTGYNFNFPFVSMDCNIGFYNNYVQPLYKHCVNINRPSMAIIGLPPQACPFQMFDLQVRFCLTFMTGRKQYPTRDEMLKDTEKDMNERWNRGLNHRKAHSLGMHIQDQYYTDLASIAQIKPIKPVVIKLYNQSWHDRTNDLETYRSYKFTILNDDNFERSLLL